MLVRRITCCLVMLLICSHQTAAQPKPAPPSKKSPGLWFVISALKKEGKEARRKDGPWPRMESNFAQEKGWSLPVPEIAKALTRKLDPEPTVDAYIKWQLLSFVDDFTPAGNAVLGRVVDSAPRPSPQPGINPQETMSLMQEWIRRAHNELIPPQEYQNPAGLLKVPRVTVGNRAVGIESGSVLPGVTITIPPDSKE